ncbi:MAG: hypothetical protein Q9182_002042 [Xanthomendoza sp. 2 TL-2023]
MTLDTETIIRLIAGRPRSPQDNHIESTPIPTPNNIDIDTEIPSFYPPTFSPSPSTLTTCNVTATSPVAAVPIDIPGCRPQEDLLAIKFPHLIKAKELTAIARSFNTMHSAKGKRAWERKALKESRKRYELEMKEPFEREVTEAMARIDLW